MRFNTSPTFSKHVPVYVHIYFIRHPVAEYATQQPDGNLTRLSLPKWEYGLQSYLITWFSLSMVTSHSCWQTGLDFRSQGRYTMAKQQCTLKLDVLWPVRTTRDNIVSWPDSHTGRESGQIPIYNLFSDTPRISWCVNWVSDEWGAQLPFLACCLESEAEDLPLQNVSQLMFTPNSLGALLQSMQYKKPDGNLTRLSPPEWESGPRDQR